MLRVDVRPRPRRRGERVTWMRLLDFLGPFERAADHDGLPVAYHLPAVWRHRVAYRIDPLLALTNKPLPADHYSPTRINGEVAAHALSHRGGN